MSAIKVESRAYFAALGKRIAMLRKSRQMTQAELSRAVGVSQQALFSYEWGDRRVSVLVLERIAKAFDMPVADLIGMAKPVRMPKGRLSWRAMRHAERLQALRRTDQRFVIRIINVLEGTQVR